jgi:hypothetical protein
MREPRDFGEGVELHANYIRSYRAAVHGTDYRRLRQLDTSISQRSYAQSLMTSLPNVADVNCSRRAHDKLLVFTTRGLQIVNMR